MSAFGKVFCFFYSPLFFCTQKLIVRDDYLVAPLLFFSIGKIAPWKKRKGWLCLLFSFVSLPIAIRNERTESDTELVSMSSQINMPRLCGLFVTTNVAESATFVLFISTNKLNDTILFVLTLFWSVIFVWIISYSH